MNGNIRLPSINGATEAEQIAQIKSYLYQLAQQLNWLFSTIGTDEKTASGGISPEDRASIIKEVEKMIGDAATAAAEATTETTETGGDTNGGE